MLLGVFTLLSVVCSLAKSSAQEESSLTIKDILSGIDLTPQTRAWRPPNYSDQKALGYEMGTFAVPSGMEERVSFWLDIYTKYTTDQGVLHDSLYVHLVYETVDFTDIMKNDELSDYQKNKAREKKVKDAKKSIAQKLHKLQRMKSPAGLEGEELRYWTMFTKINEKSKFNNASRKGRLRFQLGQKNRFLKGIYYSGRYLEKMETIFKENGLPIELTRLPFVESSFNYLARSNVGASGIWQFMRNTAKAYLKMDASVDERNDPIQSTFASAKMLASNYKMLNNWPLAVTGYNHGPSGVRRLVKKFKTENLVDLIDVRKGRFGFASANFYASFLAAIEAEKNAPKYFGENIQWDKALTGETIKLKKNISHKSLLTYFGDNLEVAKLYNPHIKNDVWKNRVAIGRGHFIRVPEKLLNHVQTHLSEPKPVALYNTKLYLIKSGDTLSDIAESYKIRLERLLKANSHINPRRLQVGQKIYIPE